MENAVADFIHLFIFEAKKKKGKEKGRVAK